VRIGAGGGELRHGADGLRLLQQHGGGDDREQEFHQDPTIQIIGEASTGREAVERACRLRPDVVLMDVRMPDLDGIAAMLSPSVTRRVIDRMAQQLSPTSPIKPGAPGLTPREREVLQLIARGLSNREIAAILVVEESTIRTHVKRLLMKLDLRDRVQAVIFAYESGLNHLPR
jgi:DNA-binding NarL/FixJ family response regulator